MTVNNFPIYKDELQMYTNLERAVVHAEISKKYPSSINDKDFWETPYDGITPNNMLFERACNKAIRDKVIQIEAVKFGIVAPRDFKAVKKAHLLENSERSNSSGVYYGPTNYPLEQYYSYLMSKTLDDIKTELLKGELKPTEEQLKASFETFDEEVLQRGFLSTGQCFLWDTNNENFDNDVLLIKGAIKSGKTYNEICGLFKNELTNLVVEEYELNSNLVHREDLIQISIMDNLANAKTGELVPILDCSLGRLYIVEGFEGGGLMTYEEVPALAQAKWINDSFEAFIDEKVASAEIKIINKDLF